MKHLFLSLVLSTIAMVAVAQQKNKSPLWEREYLQKFTAKFALDEQPSVPADTNLIAIWKMKEDIDEHNYFVVERYAPNEFVFTYMNRGGSNRTYENAGAFFSKIGDTYFINVGCYDHDKREMGFFYLKVTDLDKRGWDMTLWLVTDPSIRNFTSRAALRDYLAKNISNPAIYAKPVHMHKKLPLMYCK